MLWFQMIRDSPVTYSHLAIRSDTQHNSQRVHVHVHVGSIRGLLGSFHKPSEPTFGCSVVSTIHTHAAHTHTQHTRGGMQQRTAAHALPRELGCQHQPQMRQLTRVSSPPPSAANYSRAVRGYTIHMWKYGEMFSLQARTPGFPASEAITGPQDYTKDQHRNLVVDENH